MTLRAELPTHAKSTRNVTCWPPARRCGACVRCDRDDDEREEERRERLDEEGLRDADGREGRADVRDRAAEDRAQRERRDGRAEQLGEPIRGHAAPREVPADGEGERD